MRRGIIAWITIAGAVLMLTGCGVGEINNQGSKIVSEDTAQEGVETTMWMRIGETEVQVDWEQNEAVEALDALTEMEPLEIQMSMYGGFEQVGSIGQSLPRNDAQTTTRAGDIVLYSGNQLVVFYGSNSWGYTRLGRITGKTAEELAALLGNGDVVITIGQGQ